MALRYPPCDRQMGAHSHGGRVEIRRGIFHKHLWLRVGNGPQEQGYVTQESRFAPLTLIDAKGKVHRLEVSVDKEHGLLDVTFPMPQEGFYNVYASRQQVNNGERRFQIAKAEVLKHSCRDGHDNIQEKMPPKHSAAMALEIVRQRLVRTVARLRLMKHTIVLLFMSLMAYLSSFYAYNKACYKY